MVIILSFWPIPQECFQCTNDKYLKLELFDGQYFNQQATKNNRVDQFQRTSSRSNVYDVQSIFF